ncbi:MAG: SBBP repeat-containing protein, partial [Polyangiaceae bacterium]
MRPRRSKPISSIVAIGLFISLIAVASCDPTTSTGCPDRQTDCDGHCTALTIDPANCGACGNACIPSAKCVYGSCLVQCIDELTASGESCVDVDSADEHCGACDQPCPDTHVCVERTCLLQCEGALTKCSPTECVELDSSTSHCGECKNECAAPTNASAGCNSGVCGIGTCNAGRADCDNTLFNGCETEVTQNPKHCGECNMACAKDESCIDSVCYAEGAVQYTKSFGGTGTELAKSVALAPNGDVVIAGEFEDVVDFGGGALTSAGAEDIFVARYDKDGNHVWSKRFGGADSQELFSAAVDSEGNTLLCGRFTTAIDFGGGALPNAGGTDIFIAKLDSAGAHVWSKSFGDTGTDQCRSITIDSADNVLVAGDFTGTIDVDGTSLISQGSLDIILMTFDSDGKLAWAKAIGGASTDRAFGIASGSENDFYAVGSVTGTVDFGDGATNGIGNEDAWLARFDSNGELVWVRRVGGSSLDRAIDVVTMDNGDPVVVGFIDGTADLGTGSMSDPGGSRAGWMARYEESDGAAVLARLFTGSGSQQIKDVAVDAVDRLSIAGHFANTMSYSTVQ